MDSARRPFDRSISKEPGLKKPRLTGDNAAPDRSSNIRGFIQRPVLTNSNGGSRVQMDRDSKSSNSVRGPYQHQPGNHPQQELVDRYKIALSELTFNSKPIITNLTIIAGENLHAAKAIAAIVCSNIIEVPREQKLPSLYLLDSIVKNIGKDYIKYFASRLPEVFCKAYKQVDPSIHQSMRHLFRTWKGVFPHQPLQIIEKELGFTSTANVSSLGSTSRPDSQAQRPAHGIHVNPKYLEARQRLQATRMGGSGDNISGSLVKMHEDVEAPERNIPISPAGSWGDPYNKDFDSYITKPRIIHEDIGPRFDDETLTDSIRGTQEMPFLPEEQSQMEGRMLPGPDRNKSGYIEGYSRGLKSSENIAGRKPFQSHPDPTSIRGPNVKFSADVMPMPKVTMTQQETLGAASIDQHTPSPPFSIYGQNRQLNNKFAEHNLTSTGPPKDPRRPLGQRNAGSLDQFSQDLVPLASQDVSESSAQKFEPQNLQSSSAAMPPLHQREHVPSKQQRKLEESSCDGQKLLLSQVSGSETQSTMGNSLSDQSNPLTVDSPGQSITSSLLTAAVKCGVLGNTSLMGSSPKLVCHEVGSHSFPGGVPLPNGPPANPGFTLIKSEQPPLPPGPPPSSLAGSGSEQTPNTVNSIPNPVSSLLSSLVAKGLISASKSDSLLSDSAQKPNPSLDRGPGVPSPSSTPDSSVPVTVQKPHFSANDEPSSSKPAANVSDGLPKSTRKTKNFIGFEFRPDVVRNLRQDVVTDLLSDLPYQCSLCGLRLKLQEQFDRHKEWHALRAPEQNPLKKNSRRWYANLIDWVAGVDHFCAEDSPVKLLAESGVALESSEPMVSADESQCACIFCGELFEDFYNQERDEWMFRGAVYLTLPSESHEGIGAMGDTASLSPIVHANCISEDFIQDLGLTCNVGPKDA